MDELIFLYFVSALSAFCGLFMIWNCVQNYRNKGIFRNWRDARIVGFGRYWGLASQGVAGVMAMAIAALVPFMTPGGSPVSVAKFAFNVVSAIFLFSTILLSYWLPQKWIPQWLKDEERAEALEREYRRQLRKARRGR